MTRQVVVPTKSVRSNQKPLKQRAGLGRGKLVRPTVRRVGRNGAEHGIEPQIGTEEHRDILKRQPGHKNVSRQLDRQR